MDPLEKRNDGGCGALLASDDVRLLCALGFSAVNRGLLTEARAIFSALLLIRPQRGFAYIGMAMMHLSGGKAEEAVRVLEGATGIVAEETADVEAFLGLALQAAGRQRDSHTALEAVVARSEDSDGARLAHALLNATKSLMPVAVEASRMNSDMPSAAKKPRSAKVY